MINVCFGGYGLSWLAMQKIAERKGLVASYVPLSPEIHGKVYGATPINPDELSTYRVIGPRSIDSFPHGDDAQELKDANDLSRDDPDVVAVVEELGNAAAGPLAKLRVVEIPADVVWSIHNYDGTEHVEEAHRTWC